MSGESGVAAISGKCRSAWHALPIAIIAAAFLFYARPAIAHTGEGGFVLLLPTGYYLIGGTVAVGISFLLIALAPIAGLRRLVAAQRRLCRLPSLNPVAISAVSCFLLVLLLVAGFFGNTDPLDNPLPLFIWTVWWIGLVVAQALFGNLWSGLNPWIAPAALITWTLGRRGKAPPFPYPNRLGYWPASLAFFAFAWFELIDPAPADPTRLAIAVMIYSLWTIAGMVGFGREAWLAQAEPFSIFFALIAKLSPLLIVVTGTAVAKPERARYELRLVAPGVQLLSLAPLPVSGAAFILLVLSTVTFDGLSRTFWWLSIGGINPLEFPGRSAVIGFMTGGLTGTWLALMGLYMLVIHLGRRLGGGAMSLPAHSVAGAFIASILPISLAYHLAHYFTVFLINIQDAWVVVSDPFELDWDLFGTGEYHVSTGLLTNFDSVRIIWNIEAAIIVLGHMLAVAVAHVIAHRIWPERHRAIRGEAPLAVLMIFYTLFGLWLLATPSAG